VVWSLRIILLLAGLALVGATVVLSRRRRIEAGDAALWIVTGAVVLVFAAVPVPLEGLAAWLGLDAPVLMLLVIVGLLAAIVVRRSVAIARQSDSEKDLSGDVARLREDVARLREEMHEPLPPAAEPRPKPPSLRT
jgi:hypothetical protein